MAKNVVKVEKILEEIMPIFLDGIAKHIVDLEQAFADKDIDKVSAIAHTIRGNAGGYGFTDLGNIAGNMEDLSIAANLAAAHECYVKIKEYMEDFEIIYVDEE